MVTVMVAAGTLMAAPTQRKSIRTTAELHRVETQGEMVTKLVGILMVARVKQV